MHVDAGVKALASFPATRLAHRAGDLVRAVHRRQRPQQRLPPEVVCVEPWGTARPRRRAEVELRCRRNQPYQRIAGVRHHQTSRTRDRDAAEPAKPCVGAVTVGEPGPRAGDDPHDALERGVENASGVVGEVNVA
jgi:hypothetical protein